ncbi:hypothetical protein [Kordia jejudonensis]|uniref:hypothetical protein n=1 Tax=Kordia jejudonensis TaxID=1348245 RepID=UPI0006296118|nr:hypothetical protein [Kordia jejudonensis]
MLYILWSLLTTAFLILFFALVLSLFTKGKKLFANKYGNAIIVVLVIGVLGIMNAKEDKHKNTYAMHGNAIETNVTRSVDMRMHESASLIFHLSIRFKQNAKGEFIPSYSSSSLSGFVSGFQWKYKYINIDKNTDGTFSYGAHGVLYWDLLGINFYTQNRDFTGTFQLEEY